MSERVPIREWPEGERPRERMLRSGPENLSDAELLAIILGSGTRRASALDIARSLVNGSEGLREVATRSCAELMRLHGVGKARAVALAAAFEVGRRAQVPANGRRPVVRGPEDVARLMVPKLRDLRQEVFWVLVLDSRNGLRHMSEITRGTLSSSLVHPREVFKRAIDTGGASVIVVHNHPSGNPEPSGEDIEITRQLSEAGKILGIPLHDHLIVAGTDCISMAQKGVI